MTASAAEVEAAQKELGCGRYLWRDGEQVAYDYCVEHSDRGDWTDRGCPVAVRVADAVVGALGLTEELKTHTRTGPGKCSCGFNAYRNAGIMADYHAMTQAHFRAAQLGKIPTGRRLVSEWQEP